MLSISNNAPGPDFIIIGAMKCMTSTLHEQLAAQTGIFMTTPKEPYYFSNDEVYAHGEAWYRNLFSAAKADDLCGESSTHYTKLPTYPQSAERMHAEFPNLKLIYVMRHPVDRLISQYVHEWSVRTVDCEIDEAVDKLPEMIDYSRYSTQLEPYLRTFGPNQVLPVFFERLKIAPQLEFQRIGEFIGAKCKLEWSETLSHQNQSQERLRTSRLRDAIAFAPGISWVRRRFVPKSIRSQIKHLWQLPAKPVLSNVVQQRLIKAFDDDLCRLGEWLGIPLSCARFKEVVSKESMYWRPGARFESCSNPSQREARS